MAPWLTEDELRAYEKAGEIVRTLKAEAASRIRPGAKLLDLAEFVEAETVRRGGKPAFPCNISVNQVASHSTPPAGCSLQFCQGDVVKIDLGAIVDGYIADSAFTVEVETGLHRELLAATSLALERAIAVVRPGVATSSIGREISSTAAAFGFSVLKDLYGHNLERNCLHGGLTIANYDNGSTRKIREGDILAIEPFLTTGRGEINRVPGGGIFQVIRRGACYAGNDREKALLERLAGEYGGFPFAGRWVGADEDALQGLIRSAAVKEFPMLVEKGGAMVAQAEHTVIVKAAGCRIIT